MGERENDTEIIRNLFPSNPEVAASKLMFLGGVSSISPIDGRISIEVEPRSDFTSNFAKATPSLSVTDSNVIPIKTIDACPFLSTEISGGRITSEGEIEPPDAPLRWTILTCLRVPTSVLMFSICACKQTVLGLLGSRPNVATSFALDCPKMKRNLTLSPPDNSGRTKGFHKPLSSSMFDGSLASLLLTTSGDMTRPSSPDATLDPVLAPFTYCGFGG
mmetsp:Transcript_21121/g.32219  ORF Transcript_21121/g.32219 Transcript_21121/m.32219 type:complete len:218 (-) Transcript_21121:1153-1806(-)